LHNFRASLLLLSPRHYLISSSSKHHNYIFAAELLQYQHRRGKNTEQRHKFSNVGNIFFSWKSIEALRRERVERERLHIKIYLLEMIHVSNLQYMKTQYYQQQHSLRKTFFRIQTTGERNTIHGTKTEKASGKFDAGAVEHKHKKKSFHNCFFSVFFISFLI
jgi:hypothetical protein